MTQALQIAAPRLPYSNAFEEAYGVDRSSWRALVDAVWPAAKTVEGVMLALSYCHAKQLDPFRKVVHIVPVWSTELKRNVEGVWPGIAAYRIDAHRTDEYAGDDPTSFGPTVEFEFWSRPKNGPDDGSKDVQVKVAAPEWAQMTVYRLTKGKRYAYHGPRVVFKETYGRKSKWDECPNDRWRTSPSYMLEKCAEAAALRKAFPEALGGEITAEEMDGAAGEIRDVTPAPQRADFGDDAGAAHMAEIARPSDNMNVGNPGGPVPDRIEEPPEPDTSPAKERLLEICGKIAAATTDAGIEMVLANNASHISALNDADETTLDEITTKRRKEIAANG